MAGHVQTPRAAKVGGSGYFDRHRGSLRLRWAAEKTPGLRDAQLGAILSLAGHFATSEEPAQAVLPTGTGKTAVMCALPFFVRASRVLVVVPTRLLRDQASEAFTTLKDLRDLGVADRRLTAPKVHAVEHRLATVADWERLREYDVVIGTPQVLSGDGEDIAMPPHGLFDLLIFDEAHHLPATTWTTIAGQHQARQALLTATPFRRDRRALPGRLAYFYSMHDAMKAGIYAPVEYRPAEPCDAEPGTLDADMAIARVAVALLATPLHQDGGSRLLVRTNTVAHAEVLVGRYAGLGCQVGLIIGAHSATQVRETIARLRSGQLAGVVSVGSLIEGFDLPALKIAAYHTPHKSLPATIQFVGRLARVHPGLAPAVLIAQRDQIVSETADLYSEDASWREVLPDLNDAMVRRIKDAREYDAAFQLMPDSAARDVSVSALRPPKITQVYRYQLGDPVDLTAQLSRLNRRDVVYGGTDDLGALMAVITGGRERPDWIVSSSLDHWTYDLHLVVRVEHESLLFVSTTSDAGAAELLRAIGAPDAHRVGPRDLTRWFWSRELDGYTSVGMRASRALAASDASYKTLAGKAAQRAVLPSDTRAYSAGHLIARRRDGRQSTSIGMSMGRSKIWESTTTESLHEFRDWCFQVAATIADPRSGAGSPSDLTLGVPETLERYPNNPVLVIPDPVLYAAQVETGGVGATTDLLMLTPVSELRGASLHVEWRDENRNVVAAQDLAVTGEVHPVVGLDPAVSLEPGQPGQPFSELLDELPLTIYFADGSSVHASTMFMPPGGFPRLAPTAWQPWDFGRTDIRAESKVRKTAPRAKSETVQETALRIIAAMSPKLVLIDDGAGEIADLVAIVDRATAAGGTAGESGYEVHLFHLKFSSGNEVGLRLEDLQVVCTQAMRSLRYLHQRDCWIELDRRIRTRKMGIPVGKGLAKTFLREQARNPPPLTGFNIWVVQPGLSLWQLEHSNRASAHHVLLSMTKQACDQANAVFRLVGSEGGPAGTPGQVTPP